MSNLRGNIPAFIRITGARVSDASFLDHLRLEAGSFYVMDLGYMHRSGPASLYCQALRLGLY